jgi:uncharacterized protein YqhQ
MSIAIDHAGREASGRAVATPSATPARPYIGGQAVLEGVMMRAPSSFAVVVRRRDGSLVVRERAMVPEGRGWAKLPLLRGIASLVESLRLGSEALRFSAENMTLDYEQEDRPVARPPAALSVLGVLRALGLTTFLLASADDGAPAGPASEKKASRGTMGFMLVIVLAFFIALPQGASAFINKFFHLGLAVQSPGFQLLTGALKLTIVVGYLVGIRRIPDIRRVFQYHGAEHKTISTYEANETLVVANARTKTTLHPRCGTTFIVMIALVSIVMFTAIGSLLPRIQTGSAILDNVVFFLEKLPFLPLIVGFTFELQRISARYFTTGPLRALLWPGFLVQKITTIEPDDAQLEIALASLRATLFREEGKPGEAGDAAADVAFPSYAALAAAPSLRAA